MTSCAAAMGRPWVQWTRSTSSISRAGASRGRPPSACWSRASLARSSTGCRWRRCATPWSKNLPRALNSVARQQVAAQLATCRDPEIGLDIVSLGLVYEVNIDEGNVLIKMTLTAIGCPWAQDLFDEVKAKVEEIPGVKSCAVELVYSPPWSADMMSDDAKMELGFL